MENGNDMKNLLASLYGNSSGPSVQPTTMPQYSTPQMPVHIDGHFDPRDPAFAGYGNVMNEQVLPMSNPTPIAPGSGIGMVSSKDIHGMKNLLSRLYATAETTGTTLVEEAQYSPEVREALQTRPLKNGVAIGPKYEIRMKIMETIKGDKKTYDIINSHTNESVASELFVYEAAYSIVKLLNKGHSALSPEIRKIIGLEERYVQARQDAALFKKRYQQSNAKGDEVKMNVYEARYQNARENALTAKADIDKILKDIR